MRKTAFVFLLLFLPTIAWAQGVVSISSVVGPVEWKAVNAAKFSPLPVSTPMVHAGDQIHTGPGGNLILTFVPVPEPAQLLALCGAAALVGWVRRRPAAVRDA